MSNNTPTTPQPRVFEKPVAWLLGKQLLNSLKGILLYSAYGGKIDPRDWMAGRAFSYSRNGSNWTCDTLPSLAAPKDSTDQDEFWFDYLSDSGDGTKAVYSLAYLAMTNLWTKLTPTTKTLPPSNLEVSFSSDGQTFQLPRGQFLFFGGDTAYHTSEYMTLINRLQRPFRYAYEDLRTHQLITDDDERRNIFGIPGNHDYYDQLDGFRRQFRKPVRPEGPPPPQQSGPKNAQLSIPAFQRIQEASYVAISLPFGWWIWGLDTESPVSDRHNINVDRRQKEFFESLSREMGEFKVPDKLIVATCSPSTVFGRLADPEDPKVAKPIGDLGLARPFLGEAGERTLAGAGDDRLSSGQCRLDLSGDVHHYARYWGPSSGTQSREKEPTSTTTATSYASVVSGAGGAFHHPSTTYDGEICEQVLYPPEQESREEVAKSLFKFWNIFTGGRVWLFGFIIAFVIYVGAAVTPSSRQFISRYRVLEALNLTTREEIKPTVLQPDVDPCNNVTTFILWSKLGIVKTEWPKPEGCKPDNRAYFFALPGNWPLDLKLGQFFTWTSAGMILLTLVLAFTHLIFTDENPFKTDTRDPARIIWPILIVTTIFSLLGLLSLEPYRNYFTPFSSSLLVLYSIIAATTAIVLSMRYGDYRYKKSFVDGSGSRWLDTVCWILAILVLGFALLLFGRNNAPAFLISDIVFVLILLLGVVAIVFLLPFLVAADLLYRQSKIIAAPAKILIGTCHVVLQLLVPYILIRNGNYVVWILAAILVLASPLAQVLLKKNLGIPLAVLWAGYGALMLFLPKIVSLFYTANAPYKPTFANFTGWYGLVPAFVAALVGAIICCLWTGWYFAVCFAFNGHNNEVGGAARIEKFKQFIRFRLTREGLTGYVIAVDNVGMIGELDKSGKQRMDGNDLAPKLIDVFHLVPKN